FVRLRGEPVGENARDPYRSRGAEVSAATRLDVGAGQGDVVVADDGDRAAEAAQVLSKGSGAVRCRETHRIGVKNHGRSDVAGEFDKAAQVIDFARVESRQWSAHRAKGQGPIEDAVQSREAGGVLLAVEGTAEMTLRHDGV